MAQTATAAVTPPSTGYDYVTYLIVILTSAWGGGLTGLLKFIENDQLPHQRLRFALHMAGGVFVGVITYWYCQDAGIGEMRTHYIVALSSFGGIGTLKVLAAMAKNRKLP